MVTALDAVPGRSLADVPALTRDQMREVDRLMIASFQIGLLQMMENAGAALADLVRLWLGGRVAHRRVVVLAGRGNNGGGGLTAARRLAAWGAEVTVVLAAPEDEYRDVPGLQLAIVKRMGLSAQPFSSTLPEHDLLVDAIIGYGLAGPVRGTSKEAIVAANRSAAPAISLDMPSGLDADSGEALGGAVRATATLTLALPKVGLVQPGARQYVGQLYLADISVPSALYGEIGVDPGPVFSSGPLVRLFDG